MNENFKISAETGSGAIGGLPAIASDGTNFFIVWRDPRNSATNGYDVYGARVSHLGVVLDMIGIPISTSTGDIQVTATPSVAFDGTNYLVVWIGVVPGTSINEIFGARVSPSGNILDTSDIQLTTNGNPMPRPVSLAFDGTNYLVAWRTNDPISGDAIRGIRVSTAGVNLDSSAGFVIAARNGYFFKYPWVVFGGTNYMVVWHGLAGPDRPAGDVSGMGSGIFGARVTMGGTSLDPDGFLVSDDSSDQDHPSIAFDGSNFFVVWHDWRNTDQYGNGTGYGARVSPNGTVLDDPAFKVSDHTLWQVPVRTVFDGTQYFVVWHSSTNPAKFRLADAFGRRVSTAGTLLDEQPIPVSTSYGHQWEPVVGYDNGYYLAAWNESLSGGRSYNGGIYGQILKKEPGESPVSQIEVNPIQRASSSSIRPLRKVQSQWESVPSPISSALLSISGINANNIYISGGDGDMLRYDGNVWSFWSKLSQRMYGLFARSIDDIWAVGWCWTAPHYDGQGWGPANCQGGGIPDIYQIGFGVWATEDTNVFTVGTLGAFQKYQGYWSRDTTGTINTLWDIWGTAANNVYAVGEFGTIDRYDGTRWNKIPSANIPTKQSLNAVWGSGASDIFVVGDFGTILHYDGTHWATQNSNAHEHLFGVWGLSATDVYAVGMYGTIVHYDGSGWSVEASGTIQHLLDVWAGGNTVWAVGDQGIILRKIDLTRPPILLSPADGSTGISTSPLLTWDTYGGAYTYQLQVSEISNFATTIIDSSGIVGTSFPLSGLANNTQYYWHVNATHDSGTSDWSRTWSFTTIVSAPLSPSLVSPVNGSVDQHLTLTLAWRSSPTAMNYHLQVSTDSLFLFLVVNDSSLTDTTVEVSGLHPSAVFYWRVNSSNVSGISDYSNIWSFTTIGFPSQVQLISPPDSITIDADSVLFVWHQSQPEVTSYWFEIASDSMFTNPLIDSTLTDTLKVLQQLFNNQAYWWKVRALNDAGRGLHSEVRHISIIFTSIETNNGLPQEFSLSQNYPNPFNPSTTISFALPKSAFVNLKVLNLLGQDVATLISEMKAAGEYKVQWQAAGLPSGVYFYRLQAGSFTETRKLVLLR